MNGLDLEPFLRLVRADLGVWITLAAILGLIGVMTWTSWGSRRALRKCLVLSILAHGGLLFYGYREGMGRKDAAEAEEDGGRDRIREIQVRPVADVAGGKPSGAGRAGGTLADWDRPRGSPIESDTPLRPHRPTGPKEVATREPPEAIAPPVASPPEIAPPERPRPEVVEAPNVEVEVAEAAPAKAEEMPPIDLPQTPPADPATEVVRIRPRSRPAVEPSRPKANSNERPTIPPPRLPEVVATEPPGLPEINEVAALPAPDRREEPKSIALAPSPPSAEPRLATRPGRSAGVEARRPTLDPLPIARPAPAVPDFYKKRFEPDRTESAFKDGANEASERAVERALDWLAKHQDNDGRWNAATRKFNNGKSVAGDTDFTRHCPPGQACSGECYYWEADTALTGLSLLAFLGKGHTHTQEGDKYAATIRKGLRYLVSIQKADGDLRGESLAVGMYCHAMASLALCEAYAVSGDETLRGPVERAVDFLVQSRAADGFSWRYSPRAPSGDTSILGWVVLVFKSAQEVGISVPQTARLGAMGWLNKVAEGADGGLAVYRPGEGPYGGPGNFEPGRNMTPTMTAEAWACRQLLGMGGPGPASDEAARYLLEKAPDRDSYDFYYWYYGTLSLYQHGGASWERWNGRVRDELVSLQKTSGHEAGSWSPRDSKSRYDALGGRVYCTAVAALTLEVYYRYQRNPKAARPATDVAPSPDPTLRRAVR